jgi:hypothetical protein
LEFKKTPKVITAQDRFRAEANPEEYRDSWIRYLGALRRAFSRDMSHWKNVSVGQVYRFIQEENPTRDIIPPKGLYGIVPCNEWISSNDREFSYPFSSQENWAESRIFTRDRSNIYCIMSNRAGKLSLGIHLQGVPLGSFFPAADRSVYLQNLFSLPEYKNWWNTYVIPTSKCLEHWFDPFSVTKIATKMYGMKVSLIPKFTTPRRQEILASRNKYYARTLSPEQWMTVGSVKPVDQLSLHLFSFVKEERWDSLIRIFNSYPGFGVFTSHLENKNSLEQLHCIKQLKRWIRACENANKNRTGIDKVSRSTQNQENQVTRLILPELEDQAGDWNVLPVRGGWSLLLDEEKERVAEPEVDWLLPPEDSKEPLRFGVDEVEEIEDIYPDEIPYPEDEETPEVEAQWCIEPTDPQSAIWQTEDSSLQ